MTLRDAGYLGDQASREAVSHQISDVVDLYLCQARIVTAARATLAVHVGEVFGLRRSLQVLWVATRWVIAGVHHYVTIRDLANQRHIRQAVSQPLFTVTPAKAYDAVASSVPATAEHDALAVRHKVRRYKLDQSVDWFSSLRAMASNIPSWLPLMMALWRDGRPATAFAQHVPSYHYWPTSDERAA